MELTRYYATTPEHLGTDRWNLANAGRITP